MSEEQPRDTRPEDVQPDELQSDQERLDGFQRDTGIASDKGDQKAKDLEEKAYGGDDEPLNVPLPG
ncbi:hypothetical protein SA2016_3930 [Sinomonas atrocyanea]|uniref:Uncharacterized protein n=1 Tax=Sinomonas atrocyanea TaxID=37927 RepID=A0A127A718_9MICC|nr:hypothetical protein [Sinomonas atrocyanea]AMM34584.1 hypothetical protein SA2016_3930 [Sinomonas atrocyanea]GEB63062.1 hypothetical protein SAT01_05100 [Sinomonas atrocyanea]GGG72689.1 hypothetical protein GCM10007172_26480 [Sinomonas atrocyanea]